MFRRHGSTRVLVLALLVCLLVGGAAAVARSSLRAPLGSLVVKVPSPHGPSPSGAGSPSATSSPTGPAATATATATATAGASESTTPSISDEHALASAVAGRQQELERLARKARAFTELRTKRPVATFTMANFNVQGASHRGNVERRTRNARDLLERYGVDVAAFQEFQRPQRAAFARLAGGTWSSFPATTGHSLDAENSVVWRTDTFDLVKAETRPYRYFRGSTRNMPRVLLRHKKTGTEFWVTSYHNPATCCGYGNSAGYRARNVSAQVADANALVAQTKDPLIVAGDMNDRATYFCAMAGGTGMHSADGSTYDGSCRVAGGPWIDWVLGTRDVAFSGYVREWGGFVRATSDHPIVVTQVTVTGKPGDSRNAEN